MQRTFSRTPVSAGRVELDSTVEGEWQAWGLAAAPGKTSFGKNGICTLRGTCTGRCNSRRTAQSHMHARRNVQ